ncbi:MAG: PEGA domain-containing protein [Deltaproteobacteria bacterium]|nr:PEGA domain-containing protein [Deltaproteobacteria bacterium]
MVRNDVPPRLDAILRRALAKDPAQRFQTAGELYIALERFLAEQGEFVHAMHIGAAIEKLMPDAAAAGPFAPSSNPSGQALSLPESGPRAASDATAGSGRGEMLDGEDDDDLDTFDTLRPHEDAAMADGGIEVDLDEDLEDDDPPTDPLLGDDLPAVMKALDEAARKRDAANTAEDAPTTPQVDADAAGVPRNYTDPTGTFGRQPGAAGSDARSDALIADELLGPSMPVRVGVLLAALVGAAVVTASLVWAFSDGDPADDAAVVVSGTEGTDEAANGTEAPGTEENGTEAPGTSESPEAATGDLPTAEGPSETAPGEAVAAVPATGTVEVTSEPPGATVHLGDLEDTTPVTWEEVAAGTHSVTATLEGHEETTEEIEVEVGETAHLTLNLTPEVAEAPGEVQAPRAATKRFPARAMGLLVLDTDPRGTRVFYGRTPLGRTPLRARLPVGTVRLRLTTPDGGNHVRSVRINRRGQSRAFLPLSN